MRDTVCHCSWENGVTLSTNGLPVFTALSKDHVMGRGPRSQVQQPQNVLREVHLFKSKVVLRGECKTLIILEARIWGHFKRSAG